MVSHRSTKIFPPFYSNEGARGEGQCVDQCANLNNLSPAAHVSNTVSWGDYTVLRSPASFFFFSPPACQGSGMRGENRSLHLGWWQEPKRPARGLKVAGIHRWTRWYCSYLGQWALKTKQAWHALYNKQQNLLKWQLSSCLTLIVNKLLILCHKGMLAKYANDDILWIHSFVYQGTY